MEKLEASPIGVVHSPFKKRWKTPYQPVFAKDVRGRIEVFPEYRGGLKDLEGFSHVVVLFQFHGNPVEVMEVKPFMEDTPRGVFATRAPMRPNRIGASTVRLDKIEGNLVHIRDLDMMDGSPVLDIKPFIPNLYISGKPSYGWLEPHLGKFKPEA